MNDIHEHGTPELALRVEALEELLTEKDLLDSKAVDAVIHHFEHDVGPMDGAKVVARAWTDPDYKSRLLKDANSALEELGVGGREHLVVVENTPDTHNVVVCTLCSCYPWSVLGLPPTWYKSPAYRARIVREPRAVLKEMGLEVPDSVTIRVWDSSAELRYLVLPEQPDGTDGLSEDQLMPLINRDSMIGVAKATAPDGRHD